MIVMRSMPNKKKMAVMIKKIVKLAFATVVSLVDVIYIYDSISLFYFYISDDVLIIFKLPYEYLIMRILCALTGIILSIPFVEGKIRIISYILITIFRWFIFFIFSYPH